jgi:hypothetical protein
MLLKKYSALNFVGIEATSKPINALAMTHFHTDIWSSDLTEFKVKLVDFGANSVAAMTWSNYNSFSSKRNLGEYRYTIGDFVGDY